jgi:hypothetical protein
LGNLESPIKLITAVVSMESGLLRYVTPTSIEKSEEILDTNLNPLNQPQVGLIDAIKASAADPAVFDGTIMNGEAVCQTYPPNGTTVKASSLDYDR